MSKWQELRNKLKAKAHASNAVYKILLVLGMIAIGLPGASAVNFSAITDLINATITVMDTMVDNTDTFVGFAVLVGILGLISIIMYLFVGTLFIRAGKMIGGGLDSKGKGR